MSEATSEEESRDETVREVYELILDLSPEQFQTLLSRIYYGDEDDFQILPFPPVNAIGGWSPGRKQVPDPDGEEDQWPIQGPVPLPLPLPVPWPGGPGPTLPDDDTIPIRPSTREGRSLGRRVVTMKLATSLDELGSNDGLPTSELDITVDASEDDDYERTFGAASAGRNAVIGVIEGATGVSVSDVVEGGDTGGGDVYTDVTINADQVDVEVTIEMD